MFWKFGKSRTTASPSALLDWGALSLVLLASGAASPDDDDCVAEELWDDSAPEFDPHAAMLAMAARATTAVNLRPYLIRLRAFIPGLYFLVVGHEDMPN
jgi:hypothetical protein